MVTKPQTVTNTLFQGVDGASLGAFRILFGVMMLVAIVRYFVYGWIEAQFITPTHFFPYQGFEWIQPWPGIGMYIHFALLGVLALLIALGLFYRIAMPLFFIGFTYVHMIDKTNYLNHYYLINVLSFLMIFLPLDNHFSFKHRLRPSPPPPQSLAWHVFALRFQVAVVYIFAGIAKLRHDWLIEAQPLKIWLAQSSDLPLLGNLLDQNWTAYLFSWAGAVFDLSIVFFVLWKRTRRAAFAILIIFHLSTALLFPIGLFPWFMTAFATILLPTSWPRTMIRRTPALPSSPDFPHPTKRSPMFRPSTVALVLLTQLLLPLRQFIYAGDVLWDEQGFRFSWNVMLIEKVASAQFTVVDPATGHKWEINNADYLTPVQERMVSTQPDMIVDFAHILAKDFARRGRTKVEVYAEVWASLNGKKSRLLIDPQRDLLRDGTQ